MREIKFRAWDGKQMYEPFTLQMGLSMTETALRFNPPGWLFSVKNTYMQYTGFKDKHGTEIYECDIIKTLNGLIYEVFWCEGMVSFRLANKSTPANGYMFSSAKFDEVIGNIYEGQDLLSSEAEVQVSDTTKLLNEPEAGTQGTGISGYLRL